jgi:phosphate transport system substrate-binding protein
MCTFTSQFKEFMITRLIAILTLPILLFTSCDTREVKDNQTEGSIQVSVDESFKPVMEEQFRIFLSRFPGAKIQAEYKTEAECLKDYFDDTTRIIFIARDLTKEEREYGLSKQIVSKSMAMARDAIAVITSKDWEKPAFRMEEIRQILQGTYTPKQLQVVFDHSGSGTVHFIQDSVLKGKALSKNVFAANGSKEVVNYVSTNPNAIGLIGVSWVSDEKDSQAVAFLQQVQIASLQPDTPLNATYVQPHLGKIGLKEYPITRDLYFISKETWPGLGMGLVNYLCKDGQVLFKQARLFPLRANVFLRPQVVQPNHN